MTTKLKPRRRWQAATGAEDETSTKGSAPVNSKPAGAEQENARVARGPAAEEFTTGRSIGEIRQAGAITRAEKPLPEGPPF